MSTRGTEGGSTDVIPSKKQKISDSNIQENDGKIKLSLSGFKLEKVLNDKPNDKSVFIQGKFDKELDLDAVLILEKKAFSSSDLSEILSGQTKLQNTLQNDIYGTYDAFPPPERNGIKVTMIYPATQKHIVKYARQELHLVEETPQEYYDITLPYIQDIKFSIQWVYNILEKKTESERIVFEDPDPENGFILLPDMKWDGKQSESLYLMAICHQHGIRSLRDLTAEHLPLLRNIRDKCLVAIQDEYNVPPSKLRIYFHYQPSYYHLHVHFTHLGLKAPGSEIERAHLMSDVISNLEIDSCYYKKKTLTFVVKENDELCARFRKAGKI